MNDIKKKEKDIASKQEQEEVRATKKAMRMEVPVLNLNKGKKHSLVERPSSQAEKDRDNVAESYLSGGLNSSQ